jgi:hypothetical protein
MKDWKEGVQSGIAEMIGEKDRANELILAIDNFLKVAKVNGLGSDIVLDIEESKELLQKRISELNMQIELQKA